MDAKLIIEAVTQLGFPIVLTLGLIWWLGQRAFPRLLEAGEKIMDKFREEIERERQFHQANLDRFFDVQHEEHNEIKAEVCRKTELVIKNIDEKCAGKRE